MEEFQLSKFTEAGAKLLADVTAEFKRLGLDTSTLPKVFPDDSGKIKLVFAGQFGAGKSSIIKMLTGEDVEIGAGITTQKASPYDWHGLEIIDTPGIHTELRPDHDEITYDQINHAALLIFVITNEGFSQRMGDHFRKLAIEQKRAGNMILVVNKMDRTAGGNVPEQQKIIYEDLKKVTAPYDPKDLYLSFLDTTSYFKALEETDERRKKRRLDKSGHDIFVENLNHFVADKGVLQKINLPLNTIAAAIRAVSGVLSDEEKKQIAGLAEDISRRKKILLEGRQNCLEEVETILTRFRAEISRLGRDTTEQALNSGAQEKAEKILQKANNEIAEISKRYSKNIGDTIKKSFMTIGTNIDTYNGSVFVQQVTANAAELIQKEIVSGSLIPGGAGVIAGALIAKYGAQIAAPYAVQQTIRVATTMTKFAPLVEKFVSAFVTPDTGPIIGKGAGKVAGFLWTEMSTATVVLPPTFTNRIAQFITNNAGKIGVAISVLGFAWSIYSLVKKDMEQQENEEKIRKARQDTISNFVDSANYISRQLMTAAESFLVESIDPLISECDKDIKMLKAQTVDAQVKSEKLNALLKRTENLITEIQ